MPTTLLTGATGTLGRQVRPLLEQAGHDVRVLSRQERPAGEDRSTWRRGDLSSGLGIDAAVEGADVIVHCASGRKDATETRRLVESADELGTAHLVYISIVGVDRVQMSYYRAKLASEKIIERSGLDFTILRATQFHNLIAGLFRSQRPAPVLFTPDIPLQPIAVNEVAKRLAELAAGPPAARASYVGGTEATDGAVLGSTFLNVIKNRWMILPVEVARKSVRAARAVGLGAPEYHASGQTSAEFLRT